MKSMKTALVTGASSGLGIALAEGLAQRGYDLILTARGFDAMEALAERIRDSHGLDVIVEPADLSEPAGVRELTATLDSRRLLPTVLVNNAGFGLNERFAEAGG